MTKTLKAFNSEQLINLVKTIEFNVKSDNPEADACDVYDRVILVAAAMGSDITRHSDNPEEAATIFGQTLTDNIINMLRMTSV